MIQIQKAPEDFLKTKKNKVGVTVDDLKKMEIGDMFVMQKNGNSYNTVYSMGRYVGIKLKRKQINEKEIAVIRIA